MAQKFRKIGVLTSGGDAPGMNAAIRAVTRTAIENGIEVVGIVGGYKGLIENEIIPLSARKVSNIIERGGTFLYTARCPEFKSAEGMAKAIENCKKNNIDAIVAIGGDGTFRGATDLTNHGIPTIGITGTIDNDISASDYTVGFDTAMNTVIEMVSRLRDTGESHSRCMVVEVMGRDCGQISLLSGIALGATAIAIPEIEFDVDSCINKIQALHNDDKKGFVVIVSEGVGGVESNFGEMLTRKIGEKTGIDVKFNSLGHVVRGGSPSLRDRLTASKMGVKAVELLLEGQSNLAVCEIDSKLQPVDINYALILDRMYKNKLKPGDLDAFSAQEIEKMKETCNKKSEYIRELYSVAEILAK